MADYEAGFEDAMQLCIAELEKSPIMTEAIREAIGRLKYILGLVMEHKFDRIKQMLGALK